MKIDISKQAFEKSLYILKKNVKTIIDKQNIYLLSSVFNLLLQYSVMYLKIHRTKKLLKIVFNYKHVLYGEKLSRGESFKEVGLKRS